MWLFLIRVVYKPTCLNQDLGYNDDHHLEFCATFIITTNEKNFKMKSAVNITTINNKLAPYYITTLFNNPD